MVWNSVAVDDMLLEMAHQTNSLDNKILNDAQ